MNTTYREFLDKAIKDIAKTIDVVSEVVITADVHPVLGVEDGHAGVRIDLANYLWTSTPDIPIKRITVRTKVAPDWTNRK